MKKYYPNYSNCSVNVANSILKYFDCATYHETMPIIDEILEKKQYKNVVLYLCDGLGVKMMKDHLNADSFLMRHKVETISAVFPPTTTAATTTIMTGKMPNEHGWLGWNLYFEKEDQIITMFLNLLKDTNQQAQEYDVATTTYPTLPLYEAIQKQGHNATFLYPFRYTIYKDEEDCINQIKQCCEQEGKNYVYAYRVDPDNLMHQYGCLSGKVNENIQHIDQALEKLASQLHDTLLIVTADHGHCDVEEVYLTDYPQLEECLVREPAIEPRCNAFYVKEGSHELFKERFNQVLGQDFLLLSKEEVKQQQLFGTGVNNPHFDEAIGDFIAIATGNKYLLANPSGMHFKAHHAGLTQDEMEIPLILIECE